MGKSIHNQRYHDLIAFLRYKREEVGITQKQLAESLKIAQSVISKIENCERRLDVIELMDICQVLNTNLYNFITEFNSKAQKI